MARVRMVTRTIVGTKCNTMCVNTMTAQIEYNDFIIGVPTTDENVALKILKKEYENDTIKIVKVDTMEKYEKCYGMLESEFLNYAKELDAKTRKILESDGEIETPEEENPFTEPSENNVPIEEPKKAPKKRK